MSLRALVKVSKVTNLGDARYCAGMGVEMLGFRVISGQEYYMPPELFQDIRGWVSGPKIIAELYGVATAAEIAMVVNTYAPDYLELTYAEYKRFEQWLQLPCIVYIPLKDLKGTFVTKHDHKISYLITDKGTSCADIPPGHPVLTGVTSVHDLHARLSDQCFAGFVLETSTQPSPGVTNYEELHEILEALDEA